MILRIECSTTRRNVIQAVIDNLGLLRGVECCLAEFPLRSLILVPAEFISDLVPTLTTLMMSGDIQKFTVEPVRPGHLQEISSLNHMDAELNMFMIQAFGLQDRVCVIQPIEEKYAFLRPATDNETTAYRELGPLTVVRQRPRIEMVGVPGRDVPLELISFAFLEQIPNPT